MWWCWTTQVLLSHASKLTTHDQVSTIPPCLCLLKFVNLDFSSTSPYTDLSAKLQFLVMPFPACARQLLITRMPSLYTYASFEQHFSAQHFQHAITLAIITYENLTALKIQNAHLCSNIYILINVIYLQLLSEQNNWQNCRVIHYIYLSYYNQSSW